MWTPTARQAEFLAATEEEVLFGGAAGGGKSDALVVDALGIAHDATHRPRYRALVIRRTLKEAREVIDRSRALYPAYYPGATFHEQDKEWRFPSGAKIMFGYCERESDVYGYQGSEFQWIGVDELGHFPSSYVWEYLTSRLRTTDRDLPVYMRATCNPGPKWIMERFGVDKYGHANVVTVEIDGVTIKRRFVPSKLADNPHLKDSGYKQRLMRLPEAERRALLEGEWGVIEVPGAYYAREMQTARDAGRITAVPLEPRLPVWTAWDLGVGDSTAIWFVQSSPSGQRRLIDYYEASGEGLPHYAKVLNDRGYTYGGHIAPHDIEVRELGSGQSRLETAARLGIKFTVAPRLSFEDGINASRMLIPQCWFDTDKCAVGIEALCNYRKDYNQRLGEFTARPVHDVYSHGSDAFRYLAVSVDMMGGDVVIDDPYSGFRRAG
jgi:Terminase large subunit, T4likevirus-type, N-terminal